MVADSQESFGIVDERPLWKRKHTMFGFLAQFAYVGAQVSCATFIVNYLADNAGHTSSSASQMLSYMQITFMVARFASIPFVRFLSPATVVSIWATMCGLFAIIAAFTNPKTVGTGALFVVFFLLVQFLFEKEVTRQEAERFWFFSSHSESAIYPTVFSLATGNLGKYSKRGAGLL
jgi:FHS family L-fucose permease-like MFS transporter